MEVIKNDEMSQDDNTLTGLLTSKLNKKMETSDEDENTKDRLYKEDNNSDGSHGGDDKE